MRNCNNCKREVEDDMKFCPYCGASIEVQELCGPPDDTKTTCEDGVNEPSPQNDVANNGTEPTEPTGKSKGVAVAIGALLPLGILLTIVGILSHWAISVIGGICLGTAWSLYSVFLKK